MVTTRTKADLDFDRKQKIEWIAVKQICVVWAQSQRPYDIKHAKEIADHFDPDKFGTIAVTLPNGNGIYHAIDGQHRRNAVEMMWGGDQRVPCEVYDANDPKRAAELFEAINSARKNPQPIDRFKVRVTAGYVENVAVDKIVTSCGYVVNAGKGPKIIACVQALVWSYQTYGGEVLEQTLKLIQSTWGMDPHAVDASIVRGYSMFMGLFGRKANWQRVKDTMAKKYTPGRLIGAAKSAREIEGGSIANAVKTLIVANYNRGYPASKHLKDKDESAD